MRFKQNFLYNYLQEAPIALAVERSLECAILSKQAFPRPILDIGCGEGLFSFILFAEKIDLGIEPDARELERAKEYGAYQELLQCYGDQIPRPDGSFATIFSNSVLEHIPQLRPVLAEAYRLLRSGGRFYLTVPTDMFDKYSVLYQLLSLFRLNLLAENYRRFFNKFWKHFNYHQRAEWEEIFRASGFKIVETKEYDSKVGCLFNDFLAPFALLSFILKKTTNRCRDINIAKFK